MKLSLDRARRAASDACALEVYHNPYTQVVSFRLPVASKAVPLSGSRARARVNVYYNTGTVGVTFELWHPGSPSPWAQWSVYHTKQNVHDLRALMGNLDPWLALEKHKRELRGKPHYALPVNERGIPQGPTKTHENGKKKSHRLGWDAAPEDADAEKLHVLDERTELTNRMIELERERLAIQEALQVLDEDRKKEEEQELKRKEAIRYRIELQGRGTGLQVFAKDPEFVHTMWEPESTCCVAMGDSAALMVYDDGSWGFTSGLPQGLFKCLARLGRMRSDHGFGSAAGSAMPGLSYAVMGSHDRYFVEMQDGHIEWIGPPAFDNAVANGGVSKVAFGSTYASWFVLYQDGTVDFDDVPRALEEQLIAYQERQNTRAEHRGGHRHAKSHTHRRTGRRSAEHSKFMLLDVSLGPQGEFFVLWSDQSCSTGGLSSDLTRALHNLLSQSYLVRHIAFGSKHSWIIRYS